MTPADILAAARLSPLSPVVPAREEWLEHWVGPVLVHRHHPDVPAGFWDDGAYIGGWADSGLVRTCDQERMRLDLHRPEVRDRLIRCGAPEWCRDSVAGMLAWVLEGQPTGEYWRPLDDDEPVPAGPARFVFPAADGWYIPLPGGSVGWLPKESA